MFNLKYLFLKCEFDLRLKEISSSDSSSSYTSTAETRVAFCEDNKINRSITDRTVMIYKLIYLIWLHKETKTFQYLLFINTVYFRHISCFTDEVKLMFVTHTHEALVRACVH